MLGIFPGLPGAIIMFYPTLLDSTQRQSLEKLPFEHMII